MLAQLKDCFVLPFSPKARAKIRHEISAPVTGTLPNLLVDSRNSTMAENTYLTLAAHPEIDKLLVITGSLHVKPLQELLGRQGLQEAP